MFPVSPRQRRANFVVWWLGLELADLPDKARELAGECDHGHVGGFAPLDSEPLPLMVQALLAAPSDLARTRVLAALAARERDSDGGPVAVVVRGFDQQSAGVR